MSHMPPFRAGNVVFRCLPDAEAVADTAAGIVLDILRQKPDAAIVLPTGKTPLPLYKRLRASDANLWQSARLFQLDEYLLPENPADYQDFAAFLDEHLWNHLPGRAFYMRDYSPEAYEAAMTEQNGPDLVILGIGGNGHIAFNEPGSPPDSRTRRIRLAEETRRDNFGENARKPGYPEEAITVGIGTILASRKILLLATGEGKRSITEEAFSPAKPPDTGLPASWLKQHKDVTVITDFEVSV